MALQASGNGSVLNFPRADLRAALGTALKRHRLPESLAGALVREAAQFPEVTADAALAFALAQRMAPAPIDFEKAHGILLVGPAGAGKSAVAAKILRSAALLGRKTNFTRADGGRSWVWGGSDFHDNMHKVAEYRKFLLNGIAWIAGLDVPPGGVDAPPPPPDDPPIPTQTRGRGPGPGRMPVPAPNP